MHYLSGYETAQIYNYVGICEGQLGHAIASIEAHKIAVTMDPKVLDKHA